jgi:hypothetical protein
LEFGEIFFLDLLGLCCVNAILIIGIIGLILIRFSLKDRQLARNILITVLVVSFCWFIFPLFQLVYVAIAICKSCPDSVFRIDGEIILMSLRWGIYLLIPGIVSGFLVAFILVVPITLFVRYYRRKKRVIINNPG